jgi:FkbM family methyltransferase
VRLVSEVGRYYVLGHPPIERAAHRLEKIIRTHVQLQEIARGGTIRAVRAGNSEIRLDISDFGEYLLYGSLKSGAGFSYEPGTTALVLDALRPSALFIDVGANLGCFTLAALSKLGPRGNGLAFEPSPTTFGRLRQVVPPHDPSSRIELVNAAVADRSGTAVLYLSPVAPARDSLTPVGGPGDSVPTVRLDSFPVADRHLVIKIGVEGTKRSSWTE